MPILYGHILLWFALVWLDFVFSRAFARFVPTIQTNRSISVSTSIFTVHWIVHFNSPINDNLLIIHDVSFFLFIRSFEECQPYWLEQHVAPMYYHMNNFHIGKYSLSTTLLFSVGVWLMCATLFVLFSIIIALQAVRCHWIENWLVRCSRTSAPIIFILRRILSRQLATNCAHVKPVISLLFQSISKWLTSFD